MAAVTRRGNGRSGGDALRRPDHQHARVVAGAVESDLIVVGRALAPQGDERLKLLRRQLISGIGRTRLALGRATDVRAEVLPQAVGRRRVVAAVIMEPRALPPATMRCSCLPLRTLGCCSVYEAVRKILVYSIIR